MLRHSAMRAMRALPRRSMVTLREPGVVGLEEDSNAREVRLERWARGEVAGFDGLPGADCFRV